jgi:hypothetical protein
MYESIDGKFSFAVNNLKARIWNRTTDKNTIDYVKSTLKDLEVRSLNNPEHFTCHHTLEGIDFQDKLITIIFNEYNQAVACLASHFPKLHSSYEMMSIGLALTAKSHQGKGLFKLLMIHNVLYHFQELLHSNVSNELHLILVSSNKKILGSYAKLFSSYLFPNVNSQSIDGAVDVSHAFYEYDVKKYQGMSACPNTSTFDINNLVVHNAYREESQSFMYPVEKSDPSNIYGLLLDKVLTEIDDCLYSYSKITLNEAKLLQHQFNNIPCVSNLQIRI